MIRVIVYVGLVLSFLPIAALGWDWASNSVPSWMKFHPATYLFAVGALFNLGTLRVRYWRMLFGWPYGPLAAMTMVFIIRGLMIATSSDDPSGAFGLAITNFLTPVLFLVTTASLTAQDWRRIGAIIRTLVVISSLIAVVETASNTSFFFVQHSRLFRAGGLFGHPLASALLTGCVIVYLLVATNRRSSVVATLPEVMLHTAALFAYGGRTGLILVPLIVGISILLPAPGIPLVQRTLQRIGIVAILACALFVTQLQIDVVQGALTRFQSDAGSADTRFAAIEMVGDLPSYDLLWGVSAAERMHLLLIYDTEIAFENPWVNLILTFGAVLTFLMAAALLTALFSRAKYLDRSAYIVLIYFLVATTGYISFGSKSVAILQIMLVLSGLCQPRPITPLGWVGTEGVEGADNRTATHA